MNNGKTERTYASVRQYGRDLPPLPTSPDPNRHLLDALEQFHRSQVELEKASRELAYRARILQFTAWVLVAAVVALVLTIVVVS